MMKKESYSQILDAVAGDQIPEEPNLAPSIIARIQRGKHFRMKPKTKLISALLLVVIAFVVLFFTVPGVAAAFQRWFGYVPHVGLVHEGQIRALAEPVSLTREGITVTVEQLVINQERSTLVYSVDGIPVAAQDTPAEETLCATPSFPYEVSLRPPDGSPLLASPNGVDGWPSGYRHRFDYPPIPADVNDVTLVISCLFHTLPGAAPENWGIPLHLAPAPPEMTVYPVIEIPTSTIPPSTDTPAANATDVAALGLTFDRAVQLSDGYLLYVTLHWEDTPFNTVELIDPAKTLHLLDASGQEMVYEIYEDEQTGVQWDQRQTVFAVKTAPAQSPGSLTLELDAVFVELPVNASFVFDPGPNPKPGQQWQPNVELTFGEHRLVVRSIMVEQSGDGYSIEMTSDTGILKAGLVDYEHPILSGYDGIGSEGVFYNGFTYVNGLPEGPITLTVGGIGVKHLQKLQAQWIPPAVSVVPLWNTPNDEGRAHFQQGFDVVLLTEG